MQTAGVGYSFGKGILRDGPPYRFEFENEDAGFEAMALLDFSGQLFRELGGVTFRSLEYRIAALNICSDLARASSFQNGSKLIHWKRVFAANVDAPEKGYASVHSISV